jgi:phosphatidylglycerol:prolipoprotein diacylglycerol transferase
VITLLRLIPYLEIPGIHLFGLDFHAFGAFVAAGFVVGSHVAARRARALSLDSKVIYDAGILFLIFGFFGAHLVHLVAYDPRMLLEKPWSIFQIWSGISSFGGFLGGGLALWIYIRKHNLPFLPYADALVFGLVPGWMLGRIGCFLAHDHPGKLTAFPLAVAYPGGARHDLGLYEMFLCIALGIFIWWRARKKRPNGEIFSITIILYAITRFFLDFLRAADLTGSDARYFGLTPAQYASVALLTWGIAILRKRIRE